MKKDVVIVGAGPAGIFTALEMLKKGSKKSILIVEKGQPVEKRHCPKDKTNKRNKFIERTIQGGTHGKTWWISRRRNAGKHE